MLAAEFFNDFWLDDADVRQVPVKTRKVHPVADDEFVANVGAVVFNIYFSRPAGRLVQQDAALD